MSKAYKNHDFLMSKEARTIRILAEYLEPQKRFEEQGVKRGIIFYGSARLTPDEVDPDEGRCYYDLARGLAKAVAEWTQSTHDKAERYHVCTGGGPGIMEAANRGAYEVSEELSVGFNISLPFEQGRNAYISNELGFEFHYFFMRKFWFMNLAKALVIFPGGFGTLDELFELLTLVQTGKSPQMPIVLFGQGFWSRLLNFQMLLDHRLISEEDLQRFKMVDSIEEAMSVLKEGLAA